MGNDEKIFEDDHDIVLEVKMPLPIREVAALLTSVQGVFPEAVVTAKYSSKLLVGTAKTEGIKDLSVPEPTLAPERELMPSDTAAAPVVAMEPEEPEGEQT